MKNVLLVLGVNAVAAAVPFTPGGAGVQQAFLVKVFAGHRVGRDGRRLLGRPADRDRRRSRWRSGSSRCGRSSSSARSRTSSRPGAPTARAAATPPAEGRYCSPCRASRTSVTASGKTVAITVRICSACSAVVPWMLTRVDRRDGHVDRELDRVVGPRQALLALQLLGELRHPPLELVGISEHAAETFHATILAMAPIVEGAGVALNVVERGVGAAGAAHPRPRVRRRGDGAGGRRRSPARRA